MGHNDYPKLRIHVHGLPEFADQPTFATRSVHGHELQVFEEDRPLDVPLECSFEAFFTKFSRFQGTFAEPDGSFLWTGQSEGKRWQLEGMIYDAAGVIRRCELNGNCSEQTWGHMLSCLGWPDQQLIVHFLNEQCFAKVEELDVLWL